MVKDVKELSSTAQIISDSLQNSFTHQTSFAKRRKGNNQKIELDNPATKKYDKEWVVKLMGSMSAKLNETSLKPAVIDTVAGELYRLFLDPDIQPKTRMLVDIEENTIYVASQKKEFINFDSEKSRNIVKNSGQTYLARVNVEVLHFAEGDFKTHNGGLNQQNQTLKIDHDFSFSTLQKARERSELSDDDLQNNFKITTTDLNSLPFVKDYKPFNYFDMITEGKSASSKLFPRTLSSEQEFVREKYQQLLKAIIMPEKIIRDVIDNSLIKVKESFPEEQKKVITGYQKDTFLETKKRTGALELAAKQIPEFKKFIFNADDALIKKFALEIIKLRKDKIYLNNMDNKQIEEMLKNNLLDLQLKIIKENIHSEEKRQRVNDALIQAEEHIDGTNWDNTQKRVYRVAIMLNELKKTKSPLWGNSSYDNILLVAKQMMSQPEYKQYVDLFSTIIKIAEHSQRLKGKSKEKDLDSLLTPEFIGGYIDNKGHVSLSKEQHEALNNLKERRYGPGNESAKSYNEIVQTPLFKSL